MCRLILVIIRRTSLIVGLSCTGSYDTISSSCLSNSHIPLPLPFDHHRHLHSRKLHDRLHNLHLKAPPSLQYPCPHLPDHQGVAVLPPLPYLCAFCHGFDFFEISGWCGPASDSVFYWFPFPLIYSFFFSFCHLPLLVVLLKKMSANSEYVHSIITRLNIMWIIF